jgi:hypothetical protein
MFNDKIKPLEQLNLARLSRRQINNKLPLMRYFYHDYGNNIIVIVVKLDIASSMQSYAIRSSRKANTII